MYRSPFGQVALLAALAASPALAADLSASGAWGLTVDGTDLTAGAGSDVASEEQSATSQVTLELTNLAAASDAWRVDVARSDSTWDPDVRLWVARTSTGTGPGTITGGSSWVEVTSVTGTFFSGTGDRSGVGVQLKITGLSIRSLPPDFYASTVTYTVVDTP